MHKLTSLWNHWHWHRIAACVLVCALLLTGTIWSQAAEPATPLEDLDPEHAEKMARGLELFQGQVRAILTQNCLACHGESAEQLEGDLDLVERAGLLKGGASGPAILPGRGADSLLVQLIRHEKQPHMPQDAERLSDAQIEVVTNWIDLGAPYDTPLIQRAGEDATAWTKKQVRPEDKQHWAFLPLTSPAIPTVQQQAWCQTPLDAFILQKLEAANFAPSPPTDPRLLLRRVYFDLIGLPPPPEVVEAFARDPSPSAYESIVDQLLASPQYGERWGRHWLDLARFAESHGFEHDYDRPTAYHYRDFVIQALNADMPYSQFVRWQIAGDELAPQENLAWMATGFLAAGVHSTQITKNEVEKHRYDELDDIVATIGTSMLGLTIGCARCHDHKFDPLPQADYYRMVAAFTTVVRSEIDLNSDPVGYAQAKATFDAAHAPLVAAREAFEREQLPARLAAWEQDPANRLTDQYWTVLEPTQYKSEGGATLTKLPDGSLLASGTNPKFDTYTIEAPVPSAAGKGLRIEALSDPSLVKGGPGRASNGNFALSDVGVELVLPDGTTQSLELSQPRATFEQDGLPVAATSDDNPTSAWAIDPQFGANHAAAYLLSNALSPTAAVGTLRVTLIFKNNDGHNLGRVRLSLAHDANLALNAPAMSPAEQAALAVTPAERTDAQRQLVLNWYRHLDPDWQALHRAEQEHQSQAPQPQTFKALVSGEGLTPIRLHSQGADYFDESYFLRRGDPNQKDGVAPAGYVQVLMRTDEQSNHWPASTRPESKTSGRRTALADWITDVDQGAGHLLARVMANRLWQHHLGRGLVTTPSDFGLRGAPPSHPELLDYLAGELIRQDWRLKPLHKQIVTSAVYQQAAQIDDSQFQADRDNVLLGRRTIHRLEAEVLRDAVLAVSGTLDTSLYGAGTLDPASLRRSIYFTVKRSKLMPMMQVFDAPDALQGLPERATTTIAPQSLLLLNNPQVRAAAHAFARRVSADAGADPKLCAERAYLIALSRLPDATEASAASQFLAGQTASYEAAKATNPAHRALTDFCQMVLCLNEFAYVE
jgi:mono/diheme cytochrome c family protein